MPAFDSHDDGRVVIIDDDQLVRDFAVHTIEFGVNRKVAAFDSGLEAWKYCQSRPDQIDVVIADANMADLDGFELLAQLKRAFPSKAFIITTSNPEYVPTAGRLGADAVLLKPFDIKDLFTVVTRFIAGRGTQGVESDPASPPDGDPAHSPRH